jgi:hypothetical protein
MRHGVQPGNGNGGAVAGSSRTDRTKSTNSTDSTSGQGCRLTQLGTQSVEEPPDSHYDPAKSTCFRTARVSSTNWASGKGWRLPASRHVRWNTARSMDN